MTIIDGKEVAAAMRREIAAEVEAMVAEGKPAPHLVAILVGVLSLVVLVVHSKILRFYICGNAASIGYPKYQDLSFGLNIRLVSSPATIAAVMPPAVAFNPPVSIPRKPCWSTASLTPLASV